MAVITPTTMPSSATYTFVDGNQVQLSLVGNLPMKYCNTIVITNLSSANDVYISPESGATAETEEYILKPGLTLKLDRREDAQFDPYIRGTTGQKVSYFIG